ncbi:MAG: hypothetical protein R3B58_03365 [Phycisphaerales bacterium]
MSCDGTAHNGSRSVRPLTRQAARAWYPFTAFGVNGLAAAGNFTTIGGLPTGPAAWWDGQTWTGLGISSGIIDSLAVFDNGTSTSLYLAGSNITTQTLPSDVSLLQWVDGNLDVGPTLADNSTAWGVFNVELSSQPRLLVTGNIKAVTNPGSQPFAVYKAAAYGPDAASRHATRTAITTAISIYSITSASAMHMQRTSRTQTATGMATSTSLTTSVSGMRMQMGVP